MFAAGSWVVDVLYLVGPLDSDWHVSKWSVDQIA